MESVRKERARHIKRGFGRIATGLMMPFLAGVGAAAFTTAFVKTPPGMDGYWPLLVGAAGGAVVGALLVVAGMAELLKARRCKQVIARMRDEGLS